MADPVGVFDFTIREFMVKGRVRPVNSVIWQVFEYVFQIMELIAGFYCQQHTGYALRGQAPGFSFHQSRTLYAARAVAGALLSFTINFCVPITVINRRNNAKSFSHSSIVFQRHDPKKKCV